MGAGKYFDSMIDGKILDIHTAYLAKVISVNGRTAKIQPLGKSQDVNGNEKVQSPLSNVPYTRQIDDIKNGSIVVCICCERNITEAKKGNNVVPPYGHHSMSDSIIIGVL